MEIIVYTVFVAGFNGRFVFLAGLQSIVKEKLEGMRSAALGSKREIGLLRQVDGVLSRGRKFQEFFLGGMEEGERGDSAWPGGGGVVHWLLKSDSILAVTTLNLCRGNLWRRLKLRLPPIDNY